MRSRAGLRILMVSIVDPALSLSGAGTVTRGLLRAFEGPDLRATVECLATRPPSYHYHSLRQMASIARSFVYAMPAKAAFTFSRNFRDRVLERANREHFDLVILNGSDLLWLDTVLPSTIPRLLIAHNIEHLLFAAQAETLERSFPLLRPILRWERRRMRKVRDGRHPIRRKRHFSFQLRRVAPAGRRIGEPDFWSHHPSFPIPRPTGRGPKRGSSRSDLSATWPGGPTVRDCRGFFRTYFPTLAPTFTSISSARGRSVTPVEWRG